MSVAPEAPAPAPVATQALVVDDLQVDYIVRGVARPVLRGVSFEVRPGEAYGLVGESGCGKSTTAYTALRYLPSNGRISGGSVSFAGANVTDMSGAALREFRARTASMVFQDPGSALNPSLRIGPQLIESFTLLGCDAKQGKLQALEALRRVQIADPARVMDRYPHELSGGMQQRVVIAMALACEPKLLVLDEPTTGLDATVEAEVLDLVRTLRAELNAAILLIAHNLGIIRAICDRVGVMYAGRIVEEGPSAEVFDAPKHPYTLGLLRCLPRHGVRKSERALYTIPGSLPAIGTAMPGCVFVDRCPIATDVCHTNPPPSVQTGDGRFARCYHIDRIGEIAETPEEHRPSVDEGEVVLIAHGFSKTFHQAGHDVPALVGIELGLAEGETLGLVGESGSGKSTLAKTILGIHAPDTGGELTLDGDIVAPTTAKRSRGAKRALQMVFQNPDSALNGSWTVRRILARSIYKLTDVRGAAANQRAEQLAEHMRLSPRHLDLKPRQLSGGLKQRVAIARAFAGDPRIVVCDEPTSALDVSVQAAILNLLSDLQANERTSYLFISHDLGVVRYLADRIAVMYLGRVMELGSTDVISSGAHHPYTEALLSAVPSVDGLPSTRIRLQGEIPSPADPPTGCVFHPRCPRNLGAVCEATEPDMKEVEPGHFMRCHIPVEELRRLQKEPQG